MPTARLDERGLTLVEALLVAGIAIGLAAALAAGWYGPQRPAEQGMTLAALQAQLDQGRALATIGGATLTVAAAPSAPSSVTLYDGYLGGDPVAAWSSAVVPALVASGAVYETFSLAIRRDGSFVPYPSASPWALAPLSCAALFLALDVGGTLQSAQALDCSDARVRTVPYTPSPTSS